jgi:F-type H+-transporting ATPase subunit gamma
MPSLKSLKNRIKSVKSTQKITKAMKMVAASKLKRARERAEAVSPYAHKMLAIIGNLASSGIKIQGSGKSLIDNTGANNTHLVIVMTSDRGLCGAFNLSIVKAARKHINELLQAGKTVKIYCVGKKGHDALKNTYEDKIIKFSDGIGRKGIKTEEAQAIADYLLTEFNQDEFDICTVIFSEFKSAILQVVTNQTIIPLQIMPQDAPSASYEYEPDEEVVLSTILLQNVFVQVYRALLENTASEQGARMTAMENATKNSGDMIKRLTTVYNRTRQAHITKELIEIISGAETIKS